MLFSLEAIFFFNSVSNKMGILKLFLLFVLTRPSFALKENEESCSCNWSKLVVEVSNFTVSIISLLSFQSYLRLFFCWTCWYNMCLLFVRGSSHWKPWVLFGEQVCVQLHWTRRPRRGSFFIICLWEKIKNKNWIEFLYF